ncbi:hypothetical protein QAD02_023327 [Eretmocerus hayati]|uniref:Uncharacterized protein n=1 Tax=Eretmocerus hayati TaxID=131215 RepID=A0ACC2PVL1_9HYME|nr:hypothetical protein QAD02_023327 [Eretmocerus hayati]
MVNGCESEPPVTRENGRNENDVACSSATQQTTTAGAKPKTTTIGTIALQSGGTRLVIALLRVRIQCQKNLAKLSDIQDFFNSLSIFTRNDDQSICISTLSKKRRLE